MFIVASASASDLNESTSLESDNSLGGGVVDLVENENNQSDLSFDEKVLGLTDVEVLGEEHTPINSTEIQSAIYSADDGDTIILNGYYLINNTINVNKGLHFVGINDAIIDGGSAFKLFNLESGGVTFKNITFKNSYSDNGGSIYSNHDYTVEGCTFINNIATGYGGAMYGGTAYYCIFDSNRASQGGAMYGGAAYNCVFDSNRAKINGGSIYNVDAVDCTFEKFHDDDVIGGSTSNCEFIISTFPEEFSDIESEIINANPGDTIVINGHYSFIKSFPEFIDSGNFGGILINKSLNFVGMNDATFEGWDIGLLFKIVSDSVTFKDITFKNFRVNSNGIIYAKSNVSFENCRFINNIGRLVYMDKDASCNIANCYFENNGIYESNYLLITNDKANFTNSYFKSNTGCVILGGNLDNCTFNKNINEKYGVMSMVVLQSLGSGYEGIVKNCLFFGNSAYHGGAIYCNGDYDCAINCTFNGNYAYFGGAMSGGSAVNCRFINNSAEDGGAKYGGSARNSIFNGNHAFEGGALSACNAVNCSFRGNHAEYNGGAIYCWNAVSAVNCSFRDNYAAQYGGAIYCWNGGSVVNCSFMGNHAGDSGGAISRVDFVYNCTFISNSADYYGGAVYKCDVSNCNFSENHVECGGGALYLGNAVDCTFTGNYAMPLLPELYDYYGYGGAIDKCDALNCKFKDNHAVHGGAIMDSNAINCVFMENLAKYGGAVAFGEAGYEINNCSFINNTAQYGGAFAKTESEPMGSSLPEQYDFLVKIYGSEFSDNHATDVGDNLLRGIDESDGGAIFLDVCSAVISHCMFENNQADGFGGAINIKQGNDVDINNCQFKNCSSTDKGAAICWNEGSNLNISFCTFENCVSSEDGSFLSFSENSGEYNISDCLFDNVPEGISYSEYFNPIIVVDDLSFYNGEDAFLNITLHDIRGPLSDKTIFLKVNNTEYTNNTDINGFTSFNIKNYLSGADNYNVTVGFAGEGVDNPAYRNVTISINRYESFLTVNNLSIYVDEMGYLIANLSNIRGSLSGKILTLTVNNENHDDTTSEGLATFNIKNYITKAGEYNVTIAFAGDEYNSPISINTTVKLNKYDVVLSANNLSVYIGEEGILKVNLSSDDGPLSSKKISFILNNKYSKLTNHLGVVEFNVNNYISKAGNYDVVLSFEGDDYYNPVSIISKVNLNKYDSTLKVENLTFILGEEGILIANLSNIRGSVVGKKIIFNFGDENYTNITDSNGRIFCNVKNYLSDIGIYGVNVSFDGDEYNLPSSKEITVRINSYNAVLSVSQIGNYYKNSILMLNLINSKNNAAIPDAKIRVIFSNKKIIELTTNPNGTATYIIPFAPGTYNLSANVIDEYVGVDEVKLDNVAISNIVGKIAITQLNNTDLTVRLYNPNDNGYGYRNITVNLKFDDDNPVEIITDENGVASYSMALTSGTHTVLASVNEVYTNFEAVVDSVVVTNDSGGSGNVKFDSKVNMNPIIFNYGSSGSTVFSVVGGTIETGGISIDNHPEIKPQLVGNRIIVSGLNPGSYTLRVKTTPFDNYISVTETVSVTVNKIPAVVKSSKITVAFNKGTLWTVKIIDSKTGNPISGLKLTLKVYTGKKYKTVKLITNSKGEVYYQTKGLSKGTHKVVVSTNHEGYNLNPFTSSIKVVKQKALKFKIKKNIAKDGSSLSITVKHKNKPVNGVKLKVLVYNGKKLVKTVILKTKTKGKYKGVAGWGTNKLSVGNHKIVIMSADIKYGGSKSLKMKIKPSAKKYPKWETKI